MYIRGLRSRLFVDSSAALRLHGIHSYFPSSQLLAAATTLYANRISQHLRVDLNPVVVVTDWYGTKAWRNVICLDARVRHTIKSEGW